MEVDKVTQKHTVLSKNTLTENPVLPTSATTHHFANQQSQQKSIFSLILYLIIF